MIEWKPRQSDIDWTINHLRLLKDGSTWAVPMNGAKYIVDKTHHQLRLISGPKDDLFDKLTTVGQLIGYSVVEAREEVKVIKLDASQHGGGKAQL